MTVIPLKHHSISHNIAVIIIITLLYWISGKLGVMLANPGTNVTAIWIPSGIALAAVLLYGYRILIAIFLGSVLVNLSIIETLTPFKTPILTAFVSIVTGIGAALEAAICAGLINRYIKDRIQYFYRDRSQAISSISIYKFFAIACVSCLVSATIGTSAVVFSGVASLSLYPLTWLTWWVGDVTGIVVVTPFVMVWARFPYIYTSMPRIVEALFVILGIFFTAYMNAAPDQHFNYLYYPILMWATIRFHFHGATTTMMLMSIIVTLQTLNGDGMFVRNSVSESMLYLAVYTMVAACTSLVVSAELTQRTSTFPKRWARIPHSLKHSFKSMQNWWRLKFKR